MKTAVAGGKQNLRTTSQGSSRSQKHSSTGPLCPLMIVSEVCLHWTEEKPPYTETVYSATSVLTLKLLWLQTDTTRQVRQEVECLTTNRKRNFIEEQNFMQSPVKTIGEGEKQMQSHRNRQREAGYDPHVSHQYRRPSGIRRFSVTLTRDRMNYFPRICALASKALKWSRQILTWMRTNNVHPAQTILVKPLITPSSVLMASQADLSFNFNAA